MRPDVAGRVHVGVRNATAPAGSTATPGSSVRCSEFTCSGLGEARLGPPVSTTMRLWSPSVAPHASAKPPAGLIASRPRRRKLAASSRSAVPVGRPCARRARRTYAVVAARRRTESSRPTTPKRPLPSMPTACRRARARCPRARHEHRAPKRPPGPHGSAARISPFCAQVAIAVPSSAIASCAGGGPSSAAPRAGPKRPEASPTRRNTRRSRRAGRSRRRCGAR